MDDTEVVFTLMEQRGFPVVFMEEYIDFQNNKYAKEMIDAAEMAMGEFFGMNAVRNEDADTNEGKRTWLLGVWPDGYRRPRQSLSEFTQKKIRSYHPEDFEGAFQKLDCRGFNVRGQVAKLSPQVFRYVATPEPEAMCADSDARSEPPPPAAVPPDDERLAPDVVKAYDAVKARPAPEPGKEYRLVVSTLMRDIGEAFVRAADDLEIAGD